MSIHLYKHNEDAYRAVETMLEEKQMAAVIHPTGTGKSMIAFKLVEQHPHKHFLWLSPSEYIYKTQLENIDTQFSNIKYMSYSRLMKHEDSIDTLHPDYIILDEFHRCGAAEWGKSVRKLLEAYPKARRLGLSATNIRYLDNQRNMAEELFEGNIASEMTLGEAIVREILPEPKYVIAMYSYKKELEQLKKRIEGLSNPGLISENEKLLEQLKRALEQADGLTEVFARQMTKPDGKYIVFCSGREHMDVIFCVRILYIVDSINKIIDHIDEFDLSPLAREWFEGFGKIGGAVIHLVIGLLIGFDNAVPLKECLLLDEANRIVDNFEWMNFPEFGLEIDVQNTDVIFFHPGQHPLENEKVKKCIFETVIELDKFSVEQQNALQEVCKIITENMVSESPTIDELKAAFNSVMLPKTII